MRMSVVEHRDDAIEELLQVREVVHDLTGQLLDEPALEAAVVGLDLALPLRGGGAHGVAVGAEVDEAGAEDVGLECAAAIELEALGEPPQGAGVLEDLDGRLGALGAGHARGEHHARVIIDDGQHVHG